jgi:hypothetical protein
MPAVAALCLAVFQSFRAIDDFPWTAAAHGKRHFFPHFSYL